MSYRLLYFASLADQTGCAEETLASEARTPRVVFAEVVRRHALSMRSERLRVAVNGAFVDWEHALADGDVIVFVPPVSGG